ncbi:MAG: vitamin B12-dependent ribonucleotide reductase [Chrysiogenetes bacterium]|nr:vitamin B12-dependent ribonucleotide reductase [Chrysiogenetes bacterium]
MGQVSGKSTTKKRRKSARAVKADAGLTFARRNTVAGEDVWSQVHWETRDCSIGDASGNMVFEQKGVEVPSSWSMTATNVVVSKYFRGNVGTPERETSVRQLISRVADTIVDWGIADGYFKTDEDAEIYRAELIHLLLHQKMSFNSPVWFNVGAEKHPQCSACFINSVEDSMGAILDLAKTEGMLFKYGSGAGSNLSSIRSSKEPLQGGGTASGPVSFMKGFDSFAGVIKSGGKTRRAAKMVILNADHPDIMEFVKSKATEEKKAWALIDAGYDGGFNVPGGAYDSIFFQNANHSVRVTDSFMHAVVNDQEWFTKAVRTGEVMDKYKARELMHEITDSAWICGDPGMQYDTTINKWHTCKETARINASNPCSEYMFLDDTACNLASLNLMKFRTEDGEFDVEAFEHACRITITAQEMVVDRSSYPTPAITKNSHEFRPLGMGYANLGALLMARGLPYDSDEGRAYAAAITAIMHGAGYLQSSLIAGEKSPFAGYAKNEKSMMGVMHMHRDAAYQLDDDLVPAPMIEAARRIWDDTVDLGEENGFRNAQATVLAPTGTIGFMMDCDTTGVEPDIALVKYKKLVGGGLLKIVNQTVPQALEKLGYTHEEIDDITDYIDKNDTIEGAPNLKDEHLPVFDCAFKPANGLRSIDWRGHIKMMGAVQPFLSGAISKTVNMPSHSTQDDIAEAYIMGWKLGLKALAVYRDGCKRTQPLNTSMDKKKEEKAEATYGVRRRLPDERAARTHKFSVAGHEGYVSVGLYDDGTPGEIFIKMSKEGSTVSGLMDSFAMSVSLGLQHGVPLQTLVEKFSHTRFEPSGMTDNPDIRFAKSVMDYIFRWMDLKFLKGKGAGTQTAEERIAALAAAEETPVPDTQGNLPLLQVVEGSGQKIESKTGFQNQTDAPPCHVCGTIMYRSGACYKCANCGATSGCS